MRANRFHWDTRPVALEKNIVEGKKCRFTILTSCLIRMEYSPNNVFEDRPSQSVFYRDFPNVSFTVSRKDEQLKIETEDLILRYKEGEPFAQNSLSISLKKEPASTWKYGEDFEDLGGTCQTLDEANGAVPLGRGVCSRYGFSVIDDSKTLLLGENDWVEVRKPNTKDVYFFGYGYNYIGAVQDLYRLTGTPPLLPDYALGNWWSRYYRYTQQEYIDLMERFREEDIPFSVAVVDMDWHLVNIPEEYHDDQDPLADNGWTGYTWNKELFPDYKEFLNYLKQRNLKTALNLHPHAGVRRFDDMYIDMAKACGVKPESGKRIPFDILSPEFMGHYFDILHHPYEDDGVTFWWMDWQQGTDYSWIHEPNRDGNLKDEREVLNPLWMLNHLHILDISRNGKRPMFFSRYSGPGSQRYPVGFSGDTIVTWDSLKFQPYFTATASNIGYAWWSHDIGGHMYGYRDDELNIRWVQLGVFSPINRLHSSCNPFVQKEPWAFGEEEEHILKDWLQLRHRMFPYIYTMNYRTHRDLLPMIQPMYYTHPKCSGAYEVPGQFWFGSELVVASISEKASPISQMGRVDAWIPAGDWFDFFDGTHYASRRGRKMELYRELHGYPVLAKAGAIIPMSEHVPHDNTLGKSEKMEVLVFPGADNHFVLYEDVGDSHEYETGSFAETQMDLKWGPNPQFVIHGAVGNLNLIPEQRQWNIKLRGLHEEAEVTVLVDGKETFIEVEREKETATTVLCVTAGVTSDIVVAIKGEQLLYNNSHVMEKCLGIIKKSQLDYRTKHYLWDVLREEFTNVHQKLLRMSELSPEVRSVVGAIKEQLCLTEDEYLGSEM